MTDLIYGGRVHRDELAKLFPTAKIEDASDEIHQDRVSIDVEMDVWEYRRIVVLHGFFELSLNAQLSHMDADDQDKWIAKFVEWKRDYPEYFKPEAPHE